MDAKRGDGHNFTEECRDPTINLQQCMEEHRDYYQVHPMSAVICSQPVVSAEEFLSPEASLSMASFETPAWKAP